MRATLIQIVAVAGYVFASVAAGQMYAPGSDDALPGEELFAVCTFCHAPQGQGSQRLDAPALAGMEAWYIERQLQHFRNRTRGMHPDDVTGLQMSIVSGMLRNDATIANVSAYIESLDPGAPLETFDGEPMGTGRPYVWHSPYAEFTSPEPGNPARGEQLFSTTCSICHGATGEGSQVLGAPKLTALQDWYQARQLKYFRDGIRGTDPQDASGAQMAAISKTLTTDQAIADVVAYIDTL